MKMPVLLILDAPPDFARVLIVKVMTQLIGDLVGAASCLIRESAACGRIIADDANGMPVQTTFDSVGVENVGEIDVDTHGSVKPAGLPGVH
jgi:hypothetical protein